jgi:ketosteroid isomerase-like protein
LSEPSPSADATAVVTALAAYAADIDAWLAALDAEIEWHPFEEGPVRGREGALALRERWLASWGRHEAEIEEVIDAGPGNVVVSLHLRASGASSGAQVDVMIYMHFKVRDGLITYVYEYEDRDEALKAAGA